MGVRVHISNNVPIVTTWVSQGTFILKCSHSDNMGVTGYIYPITTLTGIPISIVG